MVGDLCPGHADGILRAAPTYRMLKAEEIGVLLRYYAMMKPQHRHRVALLSPQFSILWRRDSSLSARDHVEVNSSQIDELLMPIFVPSSAGGAGSWVCSLL